MMMEVVHRRLTRLTNEGEKLPDCLLIDGGPGQLSSAQKALSEFEQAPMIIALAKKEETLFSPYTPGPVKLPPHHPVRKLVQRIRNEVHRFAVSYHRTLRDKQMKKSSLEKIPGLGKNKALLLLRHFGSVKRISQASVEDIATIKGFSVPLAGKILSHLGKR
jgi:excinuclease ABC subunit C